MGNMPGIPDLIERLQSVLPPESAAHLVGGAVRDRLSGRETHDLDFVLAGNVLRIARQAANALGGAYYPLDEERETARIVLIYPDASRQVLDFAALRGPDLESDLRSRDFTINAMALPVHGPQDLVDPLGGAVDLRSKRIRACSPTSFLDDPLRIVRAVRQANAFRFHIELNTRRLIRAALPNLRQVSPERMRDELFRILDGPQPAVALRALDILAALPYILPELAALKGIEQSPPHTLDVWDHTLDMVQRLESILGVLGLHHDPEAAASWGLGFIAVRLGRFREQLSSHLATALNPDRSLRSLLFLAALYHDTGKPETRQLEPDGRVRFFEHEAAGEKMIGERGRQLRLSNPELDRLKTIVRNHMRPLLLAQPGEPPTRRAVYRFFRATGPAGVDICLLSLADVLATYGPGLPEDTWTAHIEVVRSLLEAWWERAAESVSPPALVDGHDLMERFGLKPGPQIGELLEMAREAQAVGQVQTRAEVLALIEASLKEGR